MPMAGRVFFLLLLLLAIQARAEQNPLVLEAGVGRYAVGPVSEVMEDRTKKLSFESAQKAFAKGKFKQEIQELPNYGFTGRAYWFRFEAIALEGEQEPWFLGLEYPLIDKIELYYQENGSWVKKESGDRRSFGTRDIKNRFFYFDIPVQSSQPTLFYLRLQTEGASEFLLYFKTLHEIMKEDHESQYLQGFFVGTLAVMIAYYLLMTIGSKSFEYLFFTSFLSALLFFKMAMNGLAFEYLWPESIWWANAAVGFSVPFVFLTALLNAFSFLPIKSHKRLSLIYLVFIGVISLECLASFFLPYIAVKGYVVTGLMATVLILTSSIFCLQKGYKPARFFMLAWTALLLGSLIFGFQKLGLIPVSFWSINGVELATLVLVVLLSVGAADKINEINKKIRRAQKAALSAQIEARRVTESMNTELESQVKARTEELRQQTKGMSVMLDNIQQGICTVDGDGAIHKEYSRYLEQILAQDSLEGRSLFDLIFNKSDQSAEQVQMLRSVLESTMLEDSLNFETNAHLLPKHIHLNQGGNRRDLEIEWAPIEDGENRVQKVLTSIRDVTDIKKAQEVAASRQRELEIMGRILDLPASKFKRFVHSTRHLLNDCYEILAKPNVRESWHMILRNAHTIKGNARTYGLDEISRAVHVLENSLFSYDRSLLGQNELDFTYKGLKTIEELLHFYEELHDEKLKRGAFADFELALVRLSVLVSEHREQMSEYLQKEFSDILGKLDQLNVNSFHKALQPIINSLKPLSEQLNKKCPTVLIRGIDFYVNPEQIEMIEDIFVHAFRNSIDHGFSADDKGEITLTITHESDGTEIVYQDNGKGLNLPVLRSKALSKNLIASDASDHEVARTIFEAGISSALVVTEISGRGVGMEAVRAFLKIMGGDVEVALDGPGRLDSYRKFHLTIRLPAQRRIEQRSIQLVAV